LNYLFGDGDWWRKDRQGGDGYILLNFVNFSFRSSGKLTLKIGWETYNRYGHPQSAPSARELRKVNRRD
jgi:hypothetical protein